MKKIFFILVLPIFLFSCDKNNSSTAQKQFANLFANPLYNDTESYLRLQIQIHYYYGLTDEAKANPTQYKQDYEELIQKMKDRYSLTDKQVTMIRNKQLYIGMHRTCVYLAWGEFDTILNEPTETKTVTADKETVTITFKPTKNKIKTAITENDILVSYKE